MFHPYSIVFALLLCCQQSLLSEAKPKNLRGSSGDEDLFEALKKFAVAENFITGTFPIAHSPRIMFDAASVGNMKDMQNVLEEFVAGKNMITGTFPGEMKALEGLATGKNTITGTFPKDMKVLEGFEAGKNSITGTFPKDMKVLEGFEAGKNSITGTFPCMPKDMKVLGIIFGEA